MFKSISRVLAVFVLFALLPLAAFAQISAQSWKLTTREDGLHLTLTLPAGLHTYPKSCGPAEITPLRSPAPLKIHDPLYDSEEEVYQGPGVFEWLLPADTTIPVQVKWQACTDDTCMMPDKASIGLDGAVLPPPQSELAPEKSPHPEVPRLRPFTLIRSADGFLTVKKFTAFLQGEHKNGVFDLEGRSFIMMLLLAIIGGMAMNLTPCVLPLLPVNLAMIGAGASSGDPRSVRIRRGTAYGAGIAVTYGILGLLSVLMGTTFGGIDSNWLFNGAVGLIFIVLALAMFEVFSLDFSAIGSRIQLPESTHFLWIFLMGGLSAVLAGACVAPVLVATLVQSAKMIAHHNYGGLFLPFAVGVGMGLPWPLMAAGFSLFPRPGRWMMRVKQGLGGLILLLALYYFHEAWTLYENRPASDTASSEKSEVNYSMVEDINTALAKSAETGLPVLLDFTAEWCKNCKVMEHSVFPDSEVQTVLKKFVFLQVHAENPSEPVTSSVMNAFEVKGLPAYRIIQPAPAALPEP